MNLVGGVAYRVPHLSFAVDGTLNFAEIRDRFHRCTPRAEIFGADLALIGFATFLTFVGYGYFDLWHGVATIALLPFFVVGIWRSRSLRLPAPPKSPATLPFEGFALFVWIYAIGLFLAGVAVVVISITSVYVPEDLAFMALCGADIESFSKRLTPVIAHDRSSFGGSLLTLGLTLLLILRRLPFTHALWQSLLLSGISGFGAAIGIHYYIGYTSPIHLGPAWLGLVVFALGLFGTRKLTTSPLKPLEKNK